MFIKTLIKTSAAIIACLALSFNTYAQKAELDVTLTRPDNNPATGIVTVTGNDSIWQKELVDGAAYFLLKNETGIVNEKNDFDILVYPNPVKNGFVTIDIGNNIRNNYTIEAYNVTGQLIDKAKSPFDNSLRIPAGYKNIILRFSNDKEKYVFRRLITFSGGNTNIKVLLHNENHTLKGAKATTNDDYEINYADSTGNLEGKTWYENIPIGTIYTIDEVLQWSQKTVFWEAITNNQSTITAEDLDDYEQLDQIVTADGNVAERGIVKRFNNENGLNIEYSLIAPYTDTAKFVVNQYMNDKFVIDSLRNGHFHLTVTGNGENYVVKNSGVIVGSGAVGSEAFFKLQGDQVPLELIVNGTGHITNTSYFDMDKGLKTKDVQLEIASDQYQHIIDGSAASNLVSKLIKDGAEAYVVKAVGDTAFINVINSKFMYSWITENSIENNVKIGVRNIVGHQNAETIADIDDNEAVVVTAIGDTCNARIPIEILNKYTEGIKGISISGIGNTKTTDAQGKTTLVKNGLETSLYNEPLTSYADSIDLSATHINDTTVNVVYVANLNNEQSFNMEELFNHILNLYVASNIPGKNIKDGSEAWYSIVEGDTITTGTANETASFGFVTKNKTENAQAGVRSIAGHSNIEDAVIVDDEEDLNLEATGDVYNASLPMLLKNQYDEAKQGLTINGMGLEKITDAQGKTTLVRDSLPTNEYNEALASYLSSLIITGDSIQTKNVDVNYVANVNPEQTLNIEELFSHILNLYVASDLLGKDIKDGSEAWYSIVEGDTITTGTANETASFSFVTKNKTENAQAGVRSIAGHSNIEDAVIIDDEEDVNLVATGDVYNASLPMLLKNQYDEAKQGLTINGMGLEKITDAQGKTTLVRDSLPTNEYNEALASYLSSLIITGDSIQTKNVDVNYVANVNPEQALSVIQEYLHWAYGNASSPDGASVEGWENGVLRVSGTVSGNAYETSKHTNIEKTFTLDSLVIKGTGKITQKEIDFLLQGETQHEFSLEDVPPDPNQYDLVFIGVDLLDNLLPAGTRMNIKEPDGDLVQKVFDGNKYQNVSVEGVFDENGELKIWFDNNVALDGNTIAINQDYKMPVASSCSWYNQDTLTVAINKLLADTSYVTVADAHVNDSIRQAAGARPGNHSWNHMEDSKRTIKPYINQTMYDELWNEIGTTNATIEQHMEDAFALAYENLDSTAQGLQIYVIKPVEKGEGWKSPTTGYMTAFVRDNTNPSNGKGYDGMFYNAADANSISTSPFNTWVEEIVGMVVEEDPLPPGDLSPFFTYNGSSVITGVNSDGNRLKALYHRWESDKLDDPND